jgi:hypothetical protein
VREHGWTNTRIVQADAGHSGLPAGSFDFTHERLVLINHLGPAQVVAELTRLTRPGGGVALVEVDWMTWVCDPPHPTWELLRDTMARAWKSYGFDPFIGRTLPRLLVAHGLSDVNFSATLLVHRAGDDLRNLLPDFVRLNRQELLARGLIGDQELATALQGLDEHLSRPDTITFYPLLCQAWGRVPV